MPEILNTVRRSQQLYSREREWCSTWYLGMCCRIERCQILTRIYACWKKSFSSTTSMFYVATLNCLLLEFIFHILAYDSLIKEASIFLKYLHKPPSSVHGKKVQISKYIYNSITQINDESKHLLFRPFKLETVVENRLTFFCLLIK